MAEPFADIARVAAMWRPLDAEELLVADLRLAQASRKIRRRFPTIDARIADGSLDRELVADICADMVIRYLQNPERKRQESIEDYSFTRESAPGLELTDEEIELLTPARTRGRAFSVDTSVRHRAPVILRRAV